MRQDVLKGTSASLKPLPAWQDWRLNWTRTERRTVWLVGGFWPLNNHNESKRHKRQQTSESSKNNTQKQQQHQQQQQKNKKKKLTNCHFLNFFLFLFFLFCFLIADCEGGKRQAQGVATKPQCSGCLHSCCCCHSGSGSSRCCRRAQCAALRNAEFQKLQYNQLN